MSSEVVIVGLDDFLGSMDRMVAAIEAGEEVLIAQVVDATFDESQKLVPYDSVTKHDEGYVHLKDSAVKDVEGLAGTLTYGTDHSLHVEFGTLRMQAQAYASPAFEATKDKFIQDSKDLVGR